MIRRRRVLFGLFAASLALSFAACGEKGEEARIAPGMMAREFTAQVEVAKSGPLGDAPAPAPAPGAITRKVITSWELTLETPRVEQALARATELARASGGWLTGTSRRKEDDGRAAASLGMRIPPGKIGGVLEQLHSLGTVMVENSTGEDVTEAYYDLEARMKTMKAAEERLLTLLARRADKLSDVLDVERELVRVRGEIESMEARKRNWDLLTETVSVQVEFVEPPRSIPAFRRIWEPVRTALGDALEGFANSLHTLVVFLGVALPWTALALLGWFLLRLLLKRRK